MKIQIPVQSSGFVDGKYAVWDELKSVTMPTTREYCANPVAGDIIVTATDRGWTTTDVVSHVRSAGIMFPGGESMPRAVIVEGLWVVRPECVFYATADDIARTQVAQQAAYAKSLAMIERGDAMMNVLSHCQAQADSDI